MLGLAAAIAAVMVASVEAEDKADGVADVLPTCAEAKAHYDKKKLCEGHPNIYPLPPPPPTHRI